MNAFTPTTLRYLAYFYTNTDRSVLEDAGLIKTGKFGDDRWKRFNHDFDVFVLKLNDGELETLTGLINDYVGPALSRRARSSKIETAPMLQQAAE